MHIPHARVSKGNFNVLKTIQNSTDPKTLHYIMTCAGKTSNYKSVMMSNRSKHLTLLKGSYF